MNNKSHGPTYNNSHDAPMAKSWPSQTQTQTQTQTHVLVGHLGQSNGWLPKPSRLGDAPGFLVLESRISEKIHEDESGCWLWTASKTRSGYGQLWYGKTMVRAHRHVYEALRSPIPADLECDHLCRVRHCVNPAHIELVTHAENMRRLAERGINALPADMQGLTRDQRYRLRKKIKAGAWVVI